MWIYIYTYTCVNIHVYTYWHIYYYINVYVYVHKCILTENTCNHNWYQSVRQTYMWIFTTLDTWWNGKDAKRIGTRPPTLHSTLNFWTRSGRIALFFWCGQLENLRKYQKMFDSWCCQLHCPLRKESLRFWFCQVTKQEQALHNSIVFKLAHR